MVTPQFGEVRILKQIGSGQNLNDMMLSLRLSELQQHTGERRLYLHCLLMAGHIKKSTRGHFSSPMIHILLEDARTALISNCMFIKKLPNIALFEQKKFFFFCHNIHKNSFYYK